MSQLYPLTVLTGQTLPLPCPPHHPGPTATLDRRLSLTRLSGERASEDAEPGLGSPYNIYPTLFSVQTSLLAALGFQFSYQSRY